MSDEYISKLTFPEIIELIERLIEELNIRYMEAVE